MKITLLEIANFKRLKAIRLAPGDKGLTIIGGKNGQGKTSVLDGIAFALGGGKRKPTNMKREGAVGEMILHIETDNGLVIERKGKNGSLSVIDKDGKRSGQALLDALISELAIDLPKFHNAKPSEKATMLLQSLGIEDQLAKFDKEIKTAYDKRTIVGQEQDRKQKHAEEMPVYEDAPDKEVSASELVKQQQEILARNGSKENARAQLDRNRELVASYTKQISGLKAQIETLETQVANLNKSIKDAESIDLTLEPTDEIEKSIEDIEETNRKVRANADRKAALADASLLKDEYDGLTKTIEDLRAQRLKLLDGAKFPLEGLTTGTDDKGNPILLLNGKAWDCMSGSQQLIVDTAIASSLNPDCQFVLLDKLEQLDLDTQHEFDEWLAARDLQCIATRVTTREDECSLIIEDGEGEYTEGTVVVPKDEKPSEKKSLDDDEDYD